VGHLGYDDGSPYISVIHEQHGKRRGKPSQGPGIDPDPLSQCARRTRSATPRAGCGAAPPRSTARESGRNLTPNAAGAPRDIDQLVKQLVAQLDRDALAAP
jgi:hypothetical protein